MFDSIRTYIENLKHDKAHRRRTLGVFCMLAALVAGGVFWRLRIIGITKTADAMCGIQEHTHTDECIVSKTLICGFPDNAENNITCNPVQHSHGIACFDENGLCVCGYADFVLHSHEENCYNSSGELICNLPQIIPHVHTDACYHTEIVYHCGYEEGTEQQEHIHNDECYVSESMLVCGMEEGEEHTHSDDCYDIQNVLVCTLSEGYLPVSHIHTVDCPYEEVRSLICTLEETYEHTHSQECFDPDGKLLCGMLEVHSHMHSAECFTVLSESSDVSNGEVIDMIGEYNAGHHVHTDDCYEYVYGCGLAEHTHTVNCYADYSADVETQDDWMSTLPQELNGDWVSDIVAVAKSQLGYAESERNFILDESGVRKSYTRYGAWYGNPYGDWNAMFAAFCLNYAGVPEEIVPRVSGCYAWYSALDDYGLIITAQDAIEQGYYPMPSDLVFFDTDGDGVTDRVGIVSELVNFGFKAIEGDVKTSSELVIPDSISIDEVLDLDNVPQQVITGVNNEGVIYPTGGFDPFAVDESHGFDNNSVIYSSDINPLETDGIENPTLEQGISDQFGIQASANLNTDKNDMPSSNIDTDSSLDENVPIDNYYNDYSSADDPYIESVPENNLFMDSVDDDNTFSDSNEYYNSIPYEDDYVDIDEEPSSDYVGEVMYYYDAPTIVGYVPLSMFGEMSAYALDITPGFHKLLGTETDGFDSALAELPEGAKLALIGNVHFNDDQNTDINYDKREYKYVMIPGAVNTAVNQQVREITSSDIADLGGIEKALKKDDLVWTIEKYTENVSNEGVETAAEGGEDGGADDGIDAAPVSTTKYRISSNGNYLVVNTDGSQNDGLCLLAPNVIESVGLMKNSLFSIKYNWGNALISCNINGKDYYLTFLFADPQSTSDDGTVVAGKPDRFNYSDSMYGHTSISLYYYIEEPEKVPDQATNNPLDRIGAADNLPKNWYTHSDKNTIGTVDMKNPYVISNGGIAMTTRNTTNGSELGFEQSTNYLQSNMQWYFEEYVGGGAASDTFTMRLYTYVNGVKKYLSYSAGTLSLIDGSSYLGDTKYAVNVDPATGEAVFRSVYGVDNKTVYLKIDGNRLSATFEQSEAARIRIFKDGKPITVSAYVTKKTDNGGAEQEVKIPQYIVAGENGSSDTPYLLTDVRLSLVNEEGLGLTNSGIQGVEGQKLESVDGILTDLSLDTFDNWLIELNTNDNAVKIYTIVNNTRMYLNYDNATEDLSLSTQSWGSVNFKPYLSSSGALMLEAFFKKGYYLGIEPGSNLFKMIKYDGTNYNPPGNIELSFIRKVTTVESDKPPSSTVINLFDYWIDTREAADVPDNWLSEGSVDRDPYMRGINKDHLLKFRVNPTSPTTNDIGWNLWTTTSKTYEGIVKSKLGDDGFPLLSDMTPPSAMPGVGGIIPNESLAYLFDPHNDAGGYKQSYINVQGLLQRDSKNYYYYDSQKNFAKFLEDENRFELYDAVGPLQQLGRDSLEGNDNWYENDKDQYGQFFPFNDLNECSTITSTSDIAWTLNDKVPDYRNYSYDLNHYFGMTLTTRFIQNFGGYINASRKDPCLFEFSGDDDVWIFIDDILVADLGGIHNKSSVSIDFSTGNVVINAGMGGDIERVTTIKTMFENAGVAGDFSWSDDHPNTFADGSTHVLRFYYLERGNNASNLSLKYLLNEIPITSIQKVDQYGDPLRNATFAVYTANENYQYVYDDGTPYSSDIPEWAQPTSQNNWQISIGGKTITPRFVGTTDDSGQLIFHNEYDAPYTITEMEKAFGKNFILREVEVPTGYRVVSDDIHMYIDNGSLLLADDQYESGVWAAPNALINAPNDLSVGREHYGNSWLLNNVNAVYDNNGNYVINDFYDPDAPEGATTKGTLFGVVLKRNGLDENVNDISNLNVSAWYPVYGSEEYGYTVSEVSGVQAAINAAREQIKLNENNANVVFYPAASGMQVDFRNMPGDPKSYYSYMSNNHSTVADKVNPQYFVAFYYTTASSIDWATTENTVRVLSRSDSAIGNNNPFSVLWGSTIRVPNFENKLLFQKLDTSGNLIKDAAFAMYRVTEIDGTTYYELANGLLCTLDTADPSSGLIEGTASMYKNNGASTEFVLSGVPYRIHAYDYTGAAKDEGYITEQNWGNINFEPSAEQTQTIQSAAGNTNWLGTTPANKGDGEFFWEGTRLVGYTHDGCSSVTESGTGHFDLLRSGNYIIREIYAPEGFSINTEEIKVVVDWTGVYANAGEEENNVSVGNGLGYLARTMETFASAGDIDQTLRWVFTALRVNDSTDNTFAEFRNNKDSWKYVRKQGNTTTSRGDNPPPYGFGRLTTQDISQAMVTYLEYWQDITASDNEAVTVFNYKANEHQEGGQYGRSTLYGQGMRRLFTNHGWSALSAYQDYSYGILQGGPANYSDLRSYNGAPNDISNLFSNSVFVRVTDKSSVNFTLIKQDENDQPLSGAEFVFYKTSDDGVKEYYSTERMWTTERTSFTTGNDGKLSFRSLDEGEYTLEEIKAPDGYEVLPPITVTVGPSLDQDGKPHLDSDGNTTYLWADGYGSIRKVGTSQSSFDYELTLVDPKGDTSISFRKTDEAGNVIDGAEFRLYMLSGDTKQYYSLSSDNKLAWVGDSANAKVFVGGEFTVTDLSKNATYYLEEIKAPPGYIPLTYPIEMWVRDGVVTLSESAGNIVTLDEKLENDKTIYTVSVKNTTGVRLPETGGVGTIPYTLGGLVLMAMSLVCGCFCICGCVKRRHERGETG